MSTETSEEINRAVLLVEYQAAQDSAQFHDGLIWTVSSIMWGGSLVLLGFLVSASGSDAVKPLAPWISVLGLCLSVSVWVIALQLRKIKNHKYGRCKAIEGLVPPLEQHRTLNHRRATHAALHSVITLIFCIVWIRMLVGAV